MAKTHFEEIKQPPRRNWMWPLVIAITVFTVTWCMVIMMVIKDTDRQWDYGVIPDVPAQSTYSTQIPPPGLSVGEPPPQIVPLPEAVPRDPDAPPKSIEPPPGWIVKP